jgi:hypothetical protein
LAKLYFGKSYDDLTWQQKTILEGIVIWTDIGLTAQQIVN